MNKKKLFSRWSPHLKTLLIFPILMLFATQDCEGMDDAERRPLLNGERRLLNVGEGGSSDPLPTYEFVSVDEVKVDMTLLEKANRDRAKSQMEVIIHFVSLHKNPKFFTQLKKKYETEAREGAISINTPEELLGFLQTKAWSALMDKPTLADYLNQRRDHSDQLIDLLTQVLEERRGLRTQNQELYEYSQRLLERLKSDRKQQQELLGEELPNPNVIRNKGNGWRYALTFGGGLVVGGVLFGLLGHYGILGHA